MGSGRDISRAVLVGNPGGVPEFTAMVAGLAGAGLLDRYVTSATPSVGGVLGRIARGPGPIGSSVRAVLGRRPDPPGVSAERIRHRAVWLDVGAALSLKMPSPRLAKPASARALAHRDRRFDRALAREMSDRDAAVIGAVGGSLITFERAQQQAVTSFLEYPTVHYREAQRIVGEEADLRPEFAVTLRHERLPRRLVQRVDRELELADFIFVFSSFHERSFRKAGIPEEKLVLTPLGVDVELFSPRPRGDHGVFRVLFVGQIGQQKGLSYLLDGFEAAALPDAELLLAGVPVGSTAPWRDRPRVRHLSHRPRNDLPKVYAGADVYVLPSLFEGFLLTALEAMACGLPVIVSEHTFAHDVIEDGVNGYVIPIRDKGAIAERLRHLHSNPRLREEMGRAARRTAERFTWRRYGERIASAVSERAGS
jgi:starch synthase